MKALLPVLLGLLGAAFSMLVWREESRLRADRLEQFTDEAFQRRWRFETSSHGRGYYRTDRWESPSEGWTAESVGPTVQYSWNMRILRWWNARRGAPPPTGPVVLLLVPDPKVLPDLSAVEGRLARIAAPRRIAKAVHKHFGEALPVTGRELQRVEGLGPTADGVVVLSDQPAEAARTLTPARLAAIRQVWSAWADFGVKRPWVGLCGDRVAIACVADRPADATHVAGLVEAGSALASARG